MLPGGATDLVNVAAGPDRLSQCPLAGPSDLANVVGTRNQRTRAQRTSTKNRAEQSTKIERTINQKFCVSANFTGAGE